MLVRLFYERILYVVNNMSMNNFVKSYPNAKRLFILTATYGDGDAPASASRFLIQLEQFTNIPKFPFAVLDFDDRQFPEFCQYAKAVEATLTAKAWSQLIPLDAINRQSPQEFSRWGNAVGTVMNTDLSLVYTST